VEDGQAAARATWAQAEPSGRLWPAHNRPRCDGRPRCVNCGGWAFGPPTTTWNIVSSKTPPCLRDGRGLHVRRCI